MKKQICFLSLALVFAAPHTAFAGSDAEGLFTVVKGQITVKSKGAAKGVQASIGSKLHEGDEVVSGPDSRAKIVMADRNVFNVSPDTKLVIEKYRNNDKEKGVQVKIDYGKLRSSLEQKYDGEKSQFNVKAGAAVAGVRGTDFISSYNVQTHESNFVTFHGAVAVSVLGPAGKISPPVMVTAGQTTSVKSNQLQAEPPKAIPQNQLQQINHETSGTADPGTGSGNAQNKSGNSKTANSRDPASTSNGTAAAGPAAGGGSMIDNRDLSPDAAKGLTSTAPPTGSGLGAAPIQVFQEMPTNGDFLKGVSGVAGGKTRVQITLTPQ